MRQHFYKNLGKKIHFFAILLGGFLITGNLVTQISQVNNQIKTEINKF